MAFASRKYISALCSSIPLALQKAHRSIACVLFVIERECPPLRCGGQTMKHRTHAQCLSCDSGYQPRANWLNGFVMSGPLFSHCVSNALIGPTAFLPTIFAGRHFVNASFPSIHNVCWLQARKILQPKAGGLGFTVPKLPRLNDLIRLAKNGADNADWVFQCNMFDWSIEKQINELKSFFLFLFLAGKPPGTRHGQMCAWRVANHHVPVIQQHIANIALIMLPWFFCWQQVA